MTGPHPSPARCGLVWLVACVGLLALAAWLLPDLADARTALAGPGLDDQPLDRLVVWLFAATGLLGAGWLWVVITFVTVEAARGADSPTRGVPPVLRRAVLAACGVALAGGIAAPAGATPGHLHLGREGSPGLAVISGLPLPDRASGAMPGAMPAAQRLTGSPVVGPSHTTSADRVEVRPGDTLWSIAAARLGPTAGPVAIQQEWQRIYAANRGVVGADPDLVHPGQQLRLPRS